MNNKETTFYAFNSNVRKFLSNLIKSPVQAKVNKFLEDRNFSKKKLINILIKRNILDRNEKITDENGKQTYNVKYKIIKRDFEKKIKQIYNDYFDENLESDKEILKEFSAKSVFKDEDAMKKNIFNGSDGEKYKKCGGIRLDETDCEESGQFTTKTFKTQRRPIYKVMENNRKKHIFITESQLNYIQEMINISNKGDKILTEDGEGGGSADGGGSYGQAIGATNASQSGEYDVPLFGDKSTLSRKNGKLGSTGISEKRWGEK